MSPNLENYATAFPSVRIVSHPDRPSVRHLVACRDFECGEVIFEESTLVHTNHPIGKEYALLGSDIPSVPVLPLDWQRLLYIWINLLHEKQDERAQWMSTLLSVDGVQSQLGQQLDPDRISDYRVGLKAFRERLRYKSFKKKKRKHADLAVPPLPSLERMLHMIETNCHARTYPAEVMAELPYLEEEQLGIWLLGSMMDHSCVNNASCDMEFRTSMDGEVAVLVVKAVQSIREGEPITISYTDMDFIPRAARQEAIQRRGFECMCRLCTGEGPTPDFGHAYFCIHCTEGVVRVFGNALYQQCDRCHARSEQVVLANEDDIDETALKEATECMFACLEAAIKREASIKTMLEVACRSVRQEFLDKGSGMRENGEIIHPYHYLLSESFLMHTGNTKVGPWNRFLSLIWLLAARCRMLEGVRDGVYISEDVNQHLRDIHMVMQIYEVELMGMLGSEKWNLFYGINGI